MRVESARPTWVQRNISPVATRLCTRLGWVDRRELVKGIIKVNEQLSDEARLHLWQALAAGSPLITPKTLVAKIFKPKIILEHALNLNLSELRHFDLSKTVTTKRLLRAANKFESDTGLLLFHKVILPIVGKKVDEFTFLDVAADEKLKVLEETLHKQRKDRILRKFKAEDLTGSGVQSKAIDQAAQFAIKYLDLSRTQVDFLIRKAVAIEANHIAVIASLFMHVDVVQLKRFFEQAAQDEAFKELVAYADPVCGIVGRARALYEKFEFDFAELGSDKKYIYRKMCELVRGADTFEVLQLFFMQKLMHLREVEHKNGGVFDEVRFILAPLAERIGLVFLADDFRDQYLRLTNPVKYKQVEDKIRERFGGITYKSAKLFLELYVDSLIDYFAGKGVNIDNLNIYFRVKSPFSSYEKVEEREEGHTYENLMDIFGIKIVYKSALTREQDLRTADSIESLLTRGEIFAPIKGKSKRLLDGQKSEWQGIKLVGHNAFGHPLVPIEIQIMTEEMNVANMHGKVAHWWYKLTNLFKMLGVEQVLDTSEPDWAITANPETNFARLRHYWTINPASIRP